MRRRFMSDEIFEIVQIVDSRRQSVSSNQSNNTDQSASICMSIARRQDCLENRSALGVEDATCGRRCSEEAIERVKVW
jgi:hypothetical protein